MATKFNLKKSFNKERDFTFWSKISKNVMSIIKNAEKEDYINEEYEPEGRTQEDIDEEDEQKANQGKDVKKESLNKFVQFFSKYVSPSEAINIANRCITMIELDKINRQGGRFEMFVLDALRKVAIGQTNIQAFLETLSKLEEIQKTPMTGKQTSQAPISPIQDENTEEETFDQKMEKYKDFPIVVFTSSGKEKRSLPPDYKKLEPDFYDIPTELIKGDGLLEEKSVKYKNQLFQMVKRSIGGNVDQEKAQSALNEAINLGRAFSKNMAPVSYRKGAFLTKALEDSGDNRIRFILSNVSLFNEYNEVFKKRTGKDLNAIVQQNGASVIQGSRNLDAYAVISKEIRQTPNNGLNDFIKSKIFSMDIGQADKNGRITDITANWIVKTAREIYYGESGFEKSTEIGEEGEKKVQIEGDAPGIHRIDETQEEQKEQVIESFKTQMTSIFEDIKKLSQAVSKKMREEGDYTGALSLENLINTYDMRLRDLFDSGRLDYDKDNISLMMGKTKAGIRGASLDPTKITEILVRKLVTRFMPSKNNLKPTPQSEEQEDSDSQKKMEQMAGEGFIKRMTGLKDLSKNVKESFEKNPSVPDISKELNISEEYIIYLLTDFDVVLEKYNIHNLGQEEKKNHDERIKDGLRPLAKKAFETKSQGPEVFDNLKPAILSESKKYDDLLKTPKRFISEKISLKKSIKSYIEQPNVLPHFEAGKVDYTEMLYRSALKKKIKDGFIGFLTKDEIKRITDAYNRNVKRPTKEDIAREIVDEENNIDINALIMAGSPRETKSNPLSVPLYSVIRHDMSGITLRYKVFDWCEKIKEMISTGNVSLESARLFIKLMNPIVAKKEKYKGIPCTEDILGVGLQDLPGRAKRPRAGKSTPEVTASSYLAFGILKRALDMACDLKSLQSGMVKTASKQNISNKIKIVMRNAFDKIDNILGK